MATTNNSHTCICVLVSLLHCLLFSAASSCLLWSFFLARHLSLVFLCPLISFYIFLTPFPYPLADLHFNEFSATSLFLSPFLIPPIHHLLRSDSLSSFTFAIDVLLAPGGTSTCGVPLVL